MTPLEAIGYSWIAWLVSWLVAAMWSGRTATRPAVRREVAYRLVTTAGAFLWFYAARGGRHGDVVFWYIQSRAGWLLAAVVVAGLAFTWWARLHLGRLWSGHVTRKEDHHIVETGPYAIVRHPIYTGLLIAIAATLLVRCTLALAAGAALMTLGFYIKARVEEEFLREQLGAEAYDSYARRVPMLIPFTARRASAGR